MNPEIKRKSLHIIAAAVPVLLIHVPREMAIFLLPLFTILNVLMDIFKQRLDLLGKVYQYFFGDILREHEKTGSLTGSTYFFLSLTLSYVLFGVLFSMPLSLLAVIYTGFMIGDAFAALVGKRFGKRKIFNNKTIEGTLAFWVACSISTVWIMPDKIHYILFSSTILAGIELFIINLDDNFFVPLMATAVLYILVC